MQKNNIFYWHKIIMQKNNIAIFRHFQTPYVINLKMSLFLNRILFPQMLWLWRGGAQTPQIKMLMQQWRTPEAHSRRAGYKNSHKQNQNLKAINKFQRL